MEARRTSELPVETPLGEGAVELVEFEGVEQISGLFHFRLKFSSEDANIDINRLVGKPISFGIRTRDRQDIRWWNGFASKARLLPEDNEVFYYEAEVVPWLWFLTKTRDCVVNQDIKVVDLVKNTFKKYGFAEGKEFEDKTEEKYTKWEYCTQYRESAFDFVNRLMEAEGIFYFFKHEKGKHTLVMGDRPSVFQPSKHQETIKVRHATGAGADRPWDMVSKWQYHSAFRSGKYTHRDYIFTKPDNPMHSEVPAKRKKEGSAKWEVYDYPGEYEENKDGDDWAKLRMEEEEVENDQGYGESDARALSAGIKFNLSDHDRRDQNGSYVVTEVRHRAQEGSQFTGQRRGPSEYTNTFKCINASHQYRPERKTPKHVMRGMQTAVVVGPKGEEIYTDEHGRVKVQFHWDRLGKKDQDSSCWMRVAHPWAGKGFGAVFLPRVGQEVLVDFIEGDPDRPIVVSRVYNTNQTHPWELPKNKNWSGFRSRSTKGGGAENYNEIKFDDTKGAEVFSMHAERDMKISVERHLQIQVDKNCHEAILGERRQSVEKNNSISIEGSHSEKVSGSHSTKVGGSVELDSDGNIKIKAGGNITLEAGGFITLKAGSGINMKGGGGRISASAMGVTLDGTMVLINCGSPDLSMIPPALNKPPSLPELIDKMKAGALGGGAMSGLASALGAAVNGAAAAMGAAISQMGGAMQAGLGQASALMGAASQIAQQAGTGPQVLQGLKDVAGQAAQGAATAAKAVADAAGALGKPLMEDAQKVENLAKKITDAAKKGAAGASEEGQAALKKLQDSAAGLKDAAAKAKDAAAEGAKVLGGEVQQAVDTAKKVVEKAKETTEKVVDKAVEGAAEGAKAVEEAFGAAKDAAGKAAETAGAAAQKVGEKLKGAAEGLQSAAEKVGEDLKEAAPHMPELPDSGGPGESGGPAGGAAGGPAPPGPESPGSPFGPEPASGGPFESILS
jgi:type VI secretion system secreted protein VgrG